jgi:hypothetical protein
MNTLDVHIGKLVKSVVRASNLKDSEFANRISKTRQNVYDLYKRDSVDVKFLLTISEALDYDFFKHFVKEQVVADTEVSVQFKLKTTEIDEVLKWLSEKGSIEAHKKK